MVVVTTTKYGFIQSSSTSLSWLLTIGTKALLIRHFIGFSTCNYCCTTARTTTRTTAVSAATTTTIKTKTKTSPLSFITLSESNIIIPSIHHSFSVSNSKNNILCTSNTFNIHRQLSNPTYNDCYLVKAKYQKLQPQRLMSFSSSNTNRPIYTNIGKEEMEEIIDDYEGGGRLESEYVIIDVRTDEEVIVSGKLSPNVYTLPIQIIMQYNVFDLSNDEFEEICGFTKPTYDETIVFTCKAGIRSVYACQYASNAGYTKLVNYMGGSSEWFATGGRTNRDLDL